MTLSRHRVDHWYPVPHHTPSGLRITGLLIGFSSLSVLSGCLFVNVPFASVRALTTGLYRNSLPQYEDMGSIPRLYIISFIHSCTTVVSNLAIFRKIFRSAIAVPSPSSFFQCYFSSGIHFYSSSFYSVLS